MRAGLNSQFNRHGSWDKLSASPVPSGARGLLGAACRQR